MALLLTISATNVLAGIQVTEGPVDLQRTIQQASDFSVLQASVIKLHPEFPTIIASNVTIVAFVAGRSPAGAWETGREWHGTVVLKSPDGRCLTLVRDKFRLESLQGVQLPYFKSSESGYSCPEREN